MGKKAEASNSKFAEKRDNVQKKAIETEQKREKEYEEFLCRFEKAKELNEQAIKITVEKTREKREKHLLKWSQNRLTARRARRDQIQKVTAEINESAQRCASARGKVLDESVGKVVERREALGDIVEQNKARLQRAEDYEREQ